MNSFIILNADQDSCATSLNVIVDNWFVSLEIGDCDDGFGNGI